MEETLPIGSIIRLNSGMNLMIIGYLPSKPNDEIIFDYVCCRTRMGLRKKENLELDKDYFYIKKMDIDKILFRGFSNFEFDMLDDLMKSINKKIIEEKNKNEELTTEDLNNIYKEAAKSFEEKWSGNSEKWIITNR